MIKFKTMAFLNTCALTLSFLFGCSLSADKNPTTNDLLPVGRLTINPELYQGKGAFALLGEAGQNDARCNGTFGINLSDCKRLKIGAEYLTQKLRYHYKTGHTQRWRQQYAVGAKYVSYLGYCWIESMNLAADFSHAKSKQLKNKNYGNGLTLKRDIAGSNSISGQAGLTFLPWENGKLTILADYDNVRYRRRYSELKRLSGFGGTIILRQKLFDCFDLFLMAEHRRPYDNYAGELRWSKRSCVGPLTIGFFGGYTQGKANLPNATTAGIQLTWSFGLGTDTICCNGKSTTFWYDSEPIGVITDWVLEPAVYLPIALLIPDQKVVYPEAT